MSQPGSNEVTMRQLLALSFASTLALTALPAAAQTEAHSLHFAEAVFDDAPPQAEVHASFSARSGALWVVGGDGDDLLHVGVADDGAIVVNGGSVAIAGLQPTLLTVSAIYVDGGNGNDLLIDTTGKGAQLAGGWGMDVLAWDDALSFDVHFHFAPDDARDFDLMVTAPSLAAIHDDVIIDGKIITAENPAWGTYFDGRFLSARDLNREQHARFFDGRFLSARDLTREQQTLFFDGRFLSARDLTRDQQTVGERVLLGAIANAAGESLFVDGPIVPVPAGGGWTSADDVWVDGKIITANDGGYVTFSLEEQDDRPVIRIDALGWDS
jgi:hypothetical protein